MLKHEAYWLAALIDGEGSIIVRWPKDRVRPKVWITIAQNDRRLLDKAVEYMDCGAIYEGIGPCRKGHQLQVFRQADVLRILKEIQSILVLKGDKAAHAIDVLQKNMLDVASRKPV
jgi:hypothetical protein